MKKLIFILVSIIFISCGTRKVNKSKIETKQEEKSEILVQSNVQSNEECKENNLAKIDKLEDDVIIQPLDTSKEFIVNGKIYKNAKIRYKKIKDNSIYQKTKIVSKNALKSEIKHINNNKINTKNINIKNIEKKINIFNYIYYIIIFIIIFIIYKLRYKIISYLRYL